MQQAFRLLGSSSRDLQVMKAIVVKEPGGADRLLYSDAEKPNVRDGEVLIRTHASGINGADILQREGQYPPPEGAPTLLGLEVAGEVQEVGEGVSAFKKGDKVISLLDGGGYAEYATAPQGLVMHLPRNLDYVQGAAVPEVWLTAYLELVWLGKLKKGEVLLIHAGASGVGSAAIQVAKALGARVFVTAGSNEKLEFCKGLGADAGINYKEDCFRQVIHEQTSTSKVATGVPIIGQTQDWGVDVILDLVGARHFQKNIDSLNLEGRLLLVSTVSGSKAEIDSLGKIIGKRLSIIGSTLRARPKEVKAKLVQEFWSFAQQKFKDGSFKPVIDKTFPLAQAKDAHDYMASSSNKGKIILTA